MAPGNGAKAETAVETTAKRTNDRLKKPRSSDTVAPEPLPCCDIALKLRPAATHRKRPHRAGNHINASIHLGPNPAS